MSADFILQAYRRLAHPETVRFDQPSFDRHPAAVATGLLVLAHAERRLAPTREAVRDALRRFDGAPPGLLEKVLLKAADAPYYTTSEETLAHLIGDQGDETFSSRLTAYAASFSAPVESTLVHLRFAEAVDLTRARLRPLVERIVEAGRIDDPSALIDTLWPAWREDGAFARLAPNILSLSVRLAIGQAHDGPVALYDPDCRAGGLVAAVAAQLPPAARIEARGRHRLALGVTGARLILADRTASLGLTMDPPGQIDDATHVVSTPAWPIGRTVPGVDPERWSTLTECVDALLPDSQPPSRPSGPADGVILSGLASMKPTEVGKSRAVFVLPVGWLFTRGQRAEGRAWLARTGWLDTMIVLPAGVWPQTSVDGVMLVIDNQRASGDPIRVVDGRDFTSSSPWCDLEMLLARTTSTEGPKVRMLAPARVGAGAKPSQLFPESLRATRLQLREALDALRASVQAAIGSPTDDTLAALERAHASMGEQIRAFADSAKGHADDGEAAHES